MADEKKQELEDLKVTEQEDGSVVVGDAPETQEVSTENEEDERVAQSAEDADEEGHAEETAEEAEARRQRNRARRQQNKERRKDYVEQLKRELAARDAQLANVAERLALVERRSTGSEMAQLDAQIKEAENYYNHFKQVSQQAIEHADGAAATDAQEKMMAARMRHQQLTNVKQAMSRQNVQQATKAAPLDPRLQMNAEEWLEEHPWYDRAGKDSPDRDSRIVASIDEDLHAQGWDPNTKEYWQELSEQVKKYLPHRAGSGHNSDKGSTPRKQSRAPVASSGRESGGNGKTYHLSAERVNALKEANMWDDPVKRAQMIKRYQEQDKSANAAN